MSASLKCQRACGARSCNQFKLPVVRKALARTAPVCRHPLLIVGFKESSKDLKDWRVKQMVDVAHSYLIDLWSKGDVRKVEVLLDDNFIYRDVVWRPERLVVGPSAMKKFIHDTRESYPDLCYEIEQVGYCDSNHIFVLWNCRGTNLAPQQGHRASHHFNYMSGIDYLGFSADRSKITEANVYRQQTEEERDLLSAKHNHGSDLQSFNERYQIQLARLHWEPDELHVE